MKPKDWGVILKRIFALYYKRWYDIENIAYPEKRAAILKFKYYLEEEAAQGRVIMDENNQPMQVKMVG